MLKLFMLNVHPIPAFTDNYIWAIVYGKSCIVVDPGDSDPVFSFLKKNDLELNCILITHHHFDHTGGLINLAKHYDCPVYGPKGGHINGITIDLAENDEINVLNLNFKIFETPGHTLDHIAYFHSSSEGSLLFCGDTLFSGGCGTLPSNIGLEKKINPFFLLDNPEIIKQSEKFINKKISSPVESLAAVRSMKDSF